jgi:hypothetical protein
MDWLPKARDNLPGNAMSRRSTKRQATGESRANEGGEALHEFLLRELPPGKTKQAPYLTNALLKTGARYDRYTARRNEWLNYATRGNRLRRISKLVEALASGLCELDILSRDDLASRVDPKEVEALVGSLRLLSRETTDLAKEVQGNGRPRDLAEERWILELADIYENAFCQPANVSGSAAGPMNRRGKFYRLLELSRPISFPRHGKLSLRQIDRMLKRRKKTLFPD